MGNITSQNAVLTLSISQVFPAPQLLQGFGVDDIYDTNEIPPTEAMMGVDGILSAGAVNVPITQSFTFQADSKSIPIFDAWIAAMKRDRNVYFAQMTTLLTAVGKEYTHVNGALTAGKKMPGAGRVLRPRTFTITWEDIQPSNI